MDTLDVPDQHRVAYLTQTTPAVDETAAVVAALRRRFPDVRGPGSDHICYATTNRQTALGTVAERSDLVLVVGSANSSNSERLVETARRRGCAARLVEDASAVRPEWLDGVVVVGVTAGASAPPDLVGGVVEALRRCGPIVVEEVETAREAVRFPAPGATSGGRAAP